MTETYTLQFDVIRCFDCGRFWALEKNSLLIPASFLFEHGVGVFVGDDGVILYSGFAMCGYAEQCHSSEPVAEAHAVDWYILINIPSRECRSSVGWWCVHFFVALQITIATTVIGTKTMAAAVIDSMIDVVITHFHFCSGGSFILVNAPRNPALRRRSDSRLR